MKVPLKIAPQDHECIKPGFVTDNLVLGANYFVIKISSVSFV